MSTYHLDRLFDPRSVALVGASPRQASVGRTILSNLRKAGFSGRLHLVNPTHGEIEGVRSVKNIADLPEVPDVIIITAPPPQIPGIIAAAGAKGVPTAIIVTAGLGHGPGSLAEASDRAARKSGMRLIGPNCLGVLLPPAKLNASFAARMPQAGDLALISQSGAIAAGLVEWAAKRSVDSPPWYRSAIRSMSILPICSTISPSTATHERFFFTSNPSATPASSYQRRAQRLASSRSW